MTYEVTPAPSTTILHHEVCSESLIQWLMRGYCQDQTCTRAGSGMQVTFQDKESNRGLEVKQVWDIPPAKCGKEGEECHPKWTLTTECRNGEARMGHEARTAKNVSAWLREICYVILLGSTTSGTQWPSYEGTVIFSLTVKISFDECFQQGENKKNQEMRA